MAASQNYFNFLMTIYKLLICNSSKLHAAASFKRLTVAWPVTKFPDFIESAG
jgi:hypothetical protein